MALLPVGRIFWGVGVGFADQSVIIYNADMAPPQWRVLLHILFQVATVTGNVAYKTSFLPSWLSQYWQIDLQYILTNDPDEQSTS